MTYSFLISVYLCCISCFWLQIPSSIAQQTSLSPFLLAGMCSLIILGNSNPNPKKMYDNVSGNFQQNWTYTLNSAIPFPFGGWGCCTILGIWLGNTPSIPWFQWYTSLGFGVTLWWCRRSRRWTRTYTWDLWRVCSYLIFACLAIRGQSCWDRISKEKGASRLKIIIVKLLEVSLGSL